MKITAFLADSVVAESGKLYAHGAGWAVLQSGAAFPMTHDRIGIGIIVSVPYTATNQQHDLSIRFEGEDGDSKPLGNAPPGTETPDGMIHSIEAGFNVGRPPNLPAGADQSIPFAINLNNLVFESPGRYRFIISIDGTEIESLAFSVLVQPGNPWRAR